MSELEAVEAVSELLANAISSFTVHFSFTFAYLTASYLVGRSLSKFQAIAVSVLYVTSATITALTVYGNQQAIEEVQLTYPSKVIDRLLMFDMTVWHAVSGVLFTAVVLLSLYFMYNVRTSKASSE